MPDIAPLAGLGWVVPILRANNLNPLLHPPRFIRKSHSPVEVAQHPVALNYIKPDAPLQLAQVHRTQVKRSSIRLGEVVRAVQQAVVPDTVCKAE